MNSNPVQLPKQSINTLYSPGLNYKNDRSVSRIHLDSRELKSNMITRTTDENPGFTCIQIQFDYENDRPVSWIHLNSDPVDLQERTVNALDSPGSNYKND